jgi:glucosamine--fructose-6-phosphate aminotransferase (isomerizing)
MTDLVSLREGIALQPQALEAGGRATSAELDATDLSPMRGGAIALVGIGASLYAATAGAAQMREQGLRAFAFPGTDLSDPAVDAADAYIAISASGRSVEPAKAMEVRPGAATYGIAKTADTPLAKVVGTMIATHSGVDSRPNSTSYVGSMQAIGLIAERVGRPSGFDWSTLSQAAARVLSKVGPAVARAAALLAGRVAVDCVGAGAARGTAGYASLLLREAVRVPAQSWDTLNFLHGPMESNDPRTGVLLFGDDREVRLAEDLADFGIPTVLVTGVEVGERANLATIAVPRLGNALAEAVIEAIPVQLLVADLADAAGLPKCEFRYRQTDTKLPTD